MFKYLLSVAVAVVATGIAASYMSSDSDSSSDERDAELHAKKQRAEKEKQREAERQALVLKNTADSVKLGVQKIGIDLKRLSKSDLDELLFIPPKQKSTKISQSFSSAMGEDLTPELKKVFELAEKNPRLVDVKKLQIKIDAIKNNISEVEKLTHLKQQFEKEVSKV